MVLVNAIEAIHPENGTLRAVVNGAAVYIDGDVTFVPETGQESTALAKARQASVEALVLANVSPPATQQKPTPAVGIAVGNDNAVAFQCYEDFGKRRYGVVADIPLNIETRRDPSSNTVSVYVRNERLSFSSIIHGGYGPRLDTRDADKWVAAILEAIALGIRYIDLVIFRTPDELIHHARAQADAAR